MTPGSRGALALCGACALACWFAASSGAAPGNTGGQLAAACASCHRLDHGDAGTASIAGMEESQLVQMLLAYRSGQRPSQIMQVVAGALSPDEIAAVAHYLASPPAAGRR